MHVSPRNSAFLGAGDRVSANLADNTEALAEHLSVPIVNQRDASLEWFLYCMQL